jgi:hypothetical protein
MERTTAAATAAATEVVNEAIEAAWAQAFGAATVPPEVAEAILVLAQTARTAPIAHGDGPLDASDASDGDSVAGSVADPGTASDSTYSASSFEDDD